MPLRKSGIAFIAITCIVASCATADTTSPSAVGSTVSVEPASVSESAEPSAETSLPLVEAGDPLEPGHVGPGRYTTEVFGDFTLTFDISADTDAVIFEGIPGIALGTGNFTNGLYVTRYDNTLITDPCDPNQTQETSASAQEVMDFLATHEELTTHMGLTVDHGPAPADVGGLPGLVLDFRVEKPQPCVGMPEPNRVYLFRLPQVGDYHVADGEVHRIYLVEVLGQVVVIDASAASRNPDAFIERMQEVVDSMAFGSVSNSD